MSENIRFNHCGPQFVVKNITKSIEFYSEVIGFGIDYINGSPPTYAVVFRDDVYIHLCDQNVIDYNLGTGATFIAISGVDELWKNVQTSEIEISEHLHEQDYGQGVKFKTFTIQDLDQNILRIGEQLK